MNRYRSLGRSGVILIATATATLARPPLHTITFNVSSNVGANALYIAVDRPELFGLTTTGAMRMFTAGGNSWTGKVAIQGSPVSTNVTFKYTARTTTSGTHCNTGNGSMSGAALATNIPLWNPGYSGKTIYYRTGWTNASILYRVGFSDTFADAAMTQIGPGRFAGEFLYQVTGIGEAGQPIEFVPHGRTTGGVEQWDNPLSGGVNNNYFTRLDTMFIQDGNIFNYTPPATVSAPQVVSVGSWASSYTGNGIPTRGGRIYLPRGYTQNTTKRYPVLYMHDGQNVFDPGGAFGSWSADAAATREIMHGRMRETIIVAVDNSNNRMSEYGTPQDGYTGNYYMQYLVKNVKPNIDSTYRTLTNFMDTGNMGSSLGGLISAYIGLSTNVFGLVGAVSPSYWYGPNFQSYINTQPTKGNRIYQDAGTAEGASMWDYFWPVYTYYLRDGYVLNDDLQIVIGCGDQHNEAAWAGRVDDAFRFLYNPWDEPNLLETNVAPSPGTIQFADAAYSVSETGTSVRLYVTRLGGASGAAGVSYATSNGTAAAGSDYTVVTSSLVWTNNDAAIKFFDVPLSDDLVFEDDEYFTVRLLSATGASLGGPAIATVTIVENETPPPELLITNPANNFVLGNGITVADVSGEARAIHWQGLSWSNALTGDSGSSPVSSSWTIAGIGLGVGTNRIVVTATNAGVTFATNAADRGSSPVYNDGWTATDNGGFGFGAWQLYTSSTNVNNNGRFMANAAAVNIGVPAWGLYANSGNLSEAKRILAAPLATGQTLRVSMDNGFIDPGSGVGVAIQNNNGDTLWEFFFNGGDQYYTISGGTTDVGWTSSGIIVELTLVGPTNYSATITPLGSSSRVINGNLLPNANSSATLCRVWNYNAGAGSDYDVFFNDMAILTAGSSLVSTSDSVNIVRIAAALHDGIPLAWWERYGLGTNSAASNDDDLDGSINRDEYIFDTVPTNAASVYSNRIVAVTMPGNFTIQAGPPTTNSRRYDIWYSTNLADSGWQPLNLNQPGAADGGAIMLTVTNHEPVSHFRTSVGLP